MISNVIFDLGNVLISFKPDEYLERNNYPEELRRLIMSDIFRSNEWLMLDNGSIDHEEAIDRISKKSLLKREEIARIFNKRTEIMFPLENNIKVLPELRKQGFKLYYLSNFPLDIFDEIKKGYPFFKYFNGGIISAKVKYSKPDPKIFNILLKKYTLDPSVSLYIDDIEVNVRSAGSLGMKGFFTAGSLDFSGDLASLLRKLQRNHK